MPSAAAADRTATAAAVAVVAVDAGVVNVIRLCARATACHLVGALTGTVPCIKTESTRASNGADGRTAADTMETAMDTMHAVYVQ